METISALDTTAYSGEKVAIKIESKEDMRKRGMSSPDRADTVAQAFSRRGFGSADQPWTSHVAESIAWGFDDQGLVIAEAARWNTARA